MWKSLMSGDGSPDLTIVAPSSWSKSLDIVATLRRYGSPPGTVAVELELARFSAIVRMRLDWARIPEAAIIMEVARSIVFSLNAQRSIAVRIIWTDLA